MSDLISIGALDNEVVAKPLTFADKIKASRRMYIQVFPDGPSEYKRGDQSMEGKPGVGKHLKKRTFKEMLEKTWGMESGQAGNWVAIANVEPSTWALFEKLIEGNLSKVIRF